MTEQRYPGIWKTLALAAAGFFAIWQFRSIQQEADISRTIEYIARFEDGGVADARRGIAATLRPYAAQFAELGNITASERNEIVTTLLDDPDNNLQEQIDQVADFYEGLLACVDEKICSGRVAVGYFSTEAAEHWINFKPYITDRRAANNQKFGRGLEWFAVRINNG